jgi:hypothetical protein
MAGQKHRGPLSPGRVRTADKRRDALNLRKAGASFREIASTLGVSVARAYVYVQEELPAVTRDAAEELLSLELSRLDTMQMALWPAVKRGEVPAIREARGIIETRARLCGLLHPPNVSVNTQVALPQPHQSVIVIEGATKEQYIDGLKMARGELPAPPAHNGNGNGHHPTTAEWTDHGDQ